jgi:hypothetical protein
MELNNQFYASAILAWKKYRLVSTSRSFSAGVKVLAKSDIPDQPLASLAYW